MNKGLKNYTKQITYEIGTVKTSVNLFKNDANMHITIPLISTKGLNRFSANLIYNYQDREQVGLFGKGYKLDCYSKIATSGNGVTVTNADGSQDFYVLDAWNQETQMKATRVYDDAYLLSSHIEFEDRSGNKKIYGTLTEYPSKVITEKTDTFTFDFVSSVKRISNGKGDEVCFSLGKSGYIEKIEYKYKNVTMESVDLTYLNGKLSSVQYRGFNGAVNDTFLFEYGINVILVTDGVKAFSRRFTFADNRVTTISEGYGQNYDDYNEKTIDISYDDNCTRVTLWNNKWVEYYFDNSGLPLFELDCDGYVVETDYDPKTKLILSESKPFLLTDDQTDYFNGKSIENFSFVNVNRQKVTLTDKWKNIVGNTVYKFTHSGSDIGYVRYNMPIDCIATDKVTAIMWVRQKYNATDSNSVEVTLAYSNSQKLKKVNYDNNFKPIVLGVNCGNTVSSLALWIRLEGDVEFELGGIKLYKKDCGTFYNYNKESNFLTSIYAKGEATKIEYDDKNNAKRIDGGDSSVNTFEYDSENYLTKTTSAYGTELKYEYHTDYPSLVTKQSLINREQDKIIETRKEYSEDGRHLIKEYDEFDVCVSEASYTNDELTSHKDAQGVVTNFEYQNNLISAMILKKNNEELSKATYEYDYFKRLKSVTLKNGSKYDFTYDERGKIKEIELDGITIFEYEYDELGEKVIKQTYGVVGEGYEFEYTDDMLSKIYYVSSNGVKSLRYSYFYNAKKQLIKVTDAQGSTLNEYTYDSEGNVQVATTSDSTIKYTYDNLGDINEVLRTVNGKSIYTAYSSASRSKSTHSLKMKDTFSKTDYFTLFDDDSAAVVYNGSSYLPAEVFVYGRDGTLPFIYKDGNRILSYQLPPSRESVFENGCVKFWFTTENVDSKQYLFGVKGKSGDYMDVYIEGKKIHAELHSNKYGKTEYVHSSDHVMPNRWNFFAFNYYFRDDGQGYQAVSEYGLTLNADTQFHLGDSGALILDVSQTFMFGTVITHPIYYIGHCSLGSTTNSFEGKIACLAIAPRWYNDNDQIKRFYSITKDFIEDCRFIDDTTKTLDVSESVTLMPSKNTKSTFEIIPLNNNVFSITGKKPTKFTERDNIAGDQDKVFSFNNKIKRYVYVADGSELAYKFGQNNIGTILLRVYTEVFASKQYILDCKDVNGNTLSLYRNGNKKLCINVNGTETVTSFTMGNDSWHTVGLSYDRIGNGTSQGYVRVYFNGAYASYNASISYSDLEVSVGRKTDSVTVGHNTGRIYECYPLYGQIEMLCASKTYGVGGVLQSMMDSDLAPITTKTEFDEFGRPKIMHITNKTTTVLSKSYDYKTRKAVKYTSMRIEKETYKHGNTTFEKKYAYDNAGNVISIREQDEETRSYRYDGRGFLTKENDTVYEYDANGNITKIGNLTLTYDNDIKDRLIKVGDDVVTYSSSSPLMPRSYAGNVYTFEGRKLITYANSSGQYTYTYNNVGLRISKSDHRGVTTKYVYDGTKLVTEIAPTYRLDFLYDENGELFGFIKDGTRRYFYIRDWMKNILGIIDNNGNVVVKYDCTAYGKVTVTTDTAGLASINPFRYKGYYYDQESGMYYCETRFYVPEWGRWLNTDSPNFIEPNKLNQLNLFAYCGNQPISRVDEYGCSWNSFWFSIKKWFEDTFGYFVELSIEDQGIDQDFFFAGYKSGVSINTIVCDNKKPISVFLKNASEWMRFWEYQIGINLNIGKFHYSASISLVEWNISLGIYNTSLDFQFGINKIGIGISHTIDSETIYSQYYIRTIPSLALVAILAFPPTCIPVIGVIISGFAMN